jgi:hypothetical protein
MRALAHALARVCAVREHDKYIAHVVNIFFSGDILKFVL